MGEAGLTAEEMKAQADVTLEKGGRLCHHQVHLTLRAKIPGADAAKFQEMAAKAEKGCPVSKLLKAEITLDAALINPSCHGPSLARPRRCR